jgi:hypothetical protein
MMVSADTDADTDIADMDANADTGAGCTRAEQDNCESGSEQGFHGKTPI